MRISCQTITWGGVVGNPIGVTSVKDLFYRASGSTEQALRDVAAAGYAGVEVFDGNLVDYEDHPEDLRRLLRETDLDLVAVYAGANFIYPDILEDELWRIEKGAQLAASFGARHLVVGGGAKRSAGRKSDDSARLADGLDRVVELATRHGLTASYHPHLTTLVEGPAQVADILGRSRIAFCPDTAHLAAGGGDAVELIRRFGDRVRYVHLKDFTADPFAFLPLGDGMVDLSGVIDALREAGYDGWLTVELDAYEGNPAEAARRSRAYLEELLAR